MISKAGLVFVVFLSACSSERSHEGKSIFRYNEHTGIASLDPAFAKAPNHIWAVNQIFNGLVALDDSLRVVPDVARRWEVSENTRYTFFLRKDVFFHKHGLFGKDSTRRVVASDFAYSMGRISDEGLASPGHWIMDRVSRYTAVNDTVFEILLKSPFPGFLGLLATKYASVVPKEAVAHYGADFGKNPIGAGPFKFKLWKENVKLVLLKNELYHETDRNGRPLPYLDAVNILFLPDRSSEFLEFIKGNIDVISGLDASYKDELLTATGQLQPKYRPTMQFLRSPFLNTEYIGFNMEHPGDEAASPDFRKALNLAFDRREIVGYLRNGVGVPALQGLIPNGMRAFSPLVRYDYNPEKALQLLKKYTRESGYAHPSIKLTTNADYLDICEFLQNEFEKIGVSTTIDLVSAATLKQLKSQGKLQAFRASWIADYPEEESYMSLFYSKNAAPYGPNYTHFRNRAFDSLYDASFTEPDVEKRTLLYRKMDSLAMSFAPIIPLYYDQSVWFVSNKVTGMAPNPINLLNLKRVKKTPEP